MNLKDIREQNNLTQHELAKLLGVSQSCIGNYESGARRPRPAVAKRIADVLGLSVEEMWEMFFKAS